jgi:hypothetical protein
MIKLTDLEIDFLRKWVNISYECDMQIFTIGDVSDKENIQRDKGVLGSLCNKDILIVDNDGIGFFCTKNSMETIKHYTDYEYISSGMYFDKKLAQS